MSSGRLKNLRFWNAEVNVVVVSNLDRRLEMTDEHQTNAIIATALLDSLKDHPNHSIGPEEAKTVAKRIIAALAEAGLQVTVVEQL